MLEAVQRCLEIWQKLVHITGGELELTKGSYAMMAWTLKDGREKLCNITDTPRSISLRSEKYQSMKVELTRNEMDTAERQLGVQLTMSGKC